MSSISIRHSKREEDLAQTQERYSMLVEKKYGAGLSEAEKEEMLRLERRLDASDADFYAPVERRLESALSRLRQRTKR
jgi:hypothetical protein